jgi:hypothetical protein
MYIVPVITGSHSLRAAEQDGTQSSLFLAGVLTLR